MHYFDPHADYEPPPDVAAKFPKEQYIAEIHYADRELGRLLKELDGGSLAPLWGSGTPPAPRTAYVESMAPRENFGWAELRALRDDRYKVIAAPRSEVYDLSADTHERVDLGVLKANESQVVALRKSLDEIASNDVPMTPQSAGALDAETRRKLAALGYVWGASGASSGPLPISVPARCSP